MLDFDSKDIDGMNDDAGEEQEPPPTGHWRATSSYEIYMVDTRKEDNGTKRTQSRIKLLESSQRTDVSGAPQNHAMVKIVIPAQEGITPRMTLKTIWKPRT